MKLIYPSFEVQWPHEYELGHYITDIENIARTCYQSHISGIYKDSKAFVKRLIDSGHEAMLEHKELCKNNLTSLSLQQTISDGF